MRFLTQSVLHYAYLQQCSEGFMHTRMRRRVESLIQVISHVLFIYLLKQNFVVAHTNILFSVTHPSSTLLQLIQDISLMVRLNKPYTKANV